MRLFWEIGKRSFQRQMMYRAATLAGLATNFFFGILRAALIVALYGSRQQEAGISLEGAITYTGVSQATIGFLSIFSWYELMNTVYTGAVSSDLLKPMSYYSFWLAQDLGRAAGQLLLRGLPMMLAYALLFGITTPSSPAQWAALAATVVLACLVSFSWRFLINLTAFWVPNAVGIGRFFFMLSYFMSGLIFPLRFFPDWFVRLCYLTPFPQTINAIVEVYLGLVTGPQIMLVLAGQLVWFLVLLAAGQAVLRAGVRRLVILGG